MLIADIGAATARITQRHHFSRKHRFTADIFHSRRFIIIRRQRLERGKKQWMSDRFAPDAEEETRAPPLRSC